MNQTTPIDPAALVCVGMITAPHGVRGAVRLKSFTEDPIAILDYGPLFDASGKRRFDIAPAGTVREQMIVKISSVGDRDAAEGLRGTKLYVPRTALPDPEEEDEYYLSDLVGLTAEWADGSKTGTVRGVADFGAGDVVEVGLSGGKVLMLPFTKDAVPVVDIKGGRLVVDPPAGLEPDDEKPGQKPKRRNTKPGQGSKKSPPATEETA